MNESSYEGKQDDIRDWQTPEIETFDNIYPDRDYSITMTIPEFTCVCPKTGLPDFAQLTLHYAPAEKCIELKSFKEYLLVYRNKGIFHENVVNKVIDDLAAAINPKQMKLVGVFNSRGGIQTTVQREYSAN
ncbi:MAG: NADPH-dependent 7-cyano-7-deazaguanine reductase QueF [Calditrichaeota bacterium]|nr:MAG: NADPH-dependent 7-cyano-7-deazaguanine reductase QueF [Calditrichota bacterium]